MGTQPGATMGAQPGATMGAQPGATMGAQPGATMGMQPGATMGMQPGATMGMSGGRYKKYSKKGGNNLPPGLIEALQSGALSGALSGSQTGAQTGSMPMPGAQPLVPPGASPFTQPAVSQPMTPQIMSGGYYKKYNKKGGNSIFTPGATFSSQPAEIATQMNPLAQAQHIPKGGFAMKDMGGVSAQMAASGSYLNVMSGGKKSSKKLKGGVSDFATTLASRGPINYPDQPSADRFRYFNKTGTFIPNTMLQYAAAPISTGYEKDSNPYPMAYNDYIGGTKKKAPKKKSTTSTKKKSTTSTKKKTTSSTKKASPKKKSASTKKKSTSGKKK